MSEFLVTGGRKLAGELSVQGAKNSVLPIMAAALLVPGKTVLHNCPDLSDVRTAMEILSQLGCAVSREGHTLVIDARDIISHAVSEQLMRGMRSSVIFLGAILARCAAAQLSFPGGCELGPRPIDLHLDALRQMGYEIDAHASSISCMAKSPRAAQITLAFPSVGATENVMLAATACRGTTRIINAAMEPEIVDLQEFLRAAGAHVTGAGTPVIEITGDAPLKECEYTVMPDRIAAVTWLCAAAATGGHIRLPNAVAAHIASVLSVLKTCGCELDLTQGVELRAPTRPSSAGTIKTLPYPGFPTDAQAIVMALMCTACGSTMFEETIFENRYRHVEGLTRMGAHIHVTGRVAMVTGVPRLTGAAAEASDLRGGAALVAAALSAEGESIIGGVHHIDRGYEHMEDALCTLGAEIKRRACV